RDHRLIERGQRGHGSPMLAVTRLRIGMRRLLVLVLAIVALAPAAAWAVEFHPSWGDAIIDDNAFYETNGTLLPSNQPLPRGQIRDHATDGHAVTLRVIAFNASGQNIGEFTVSEGNAVYKSFSQRFNLAQPISYLGYDFCAGSTCLARHRIGRPAAATPTPTTPPGPPPTPTPAPVDRDGDGPSPP